MQLSRIRGDFPSNVKRRKEMKSKLFMAGGLVSGCQFLFLFFFFGFSVSTLRAAYLPLSCPSPSSSSTFPLCSPSSQFSLIVSPSFTWLAHFSFPPFALPFNFNFPRHSSKKRFFNYFTGVYGFRPASCFTYGGPNSSVIPLFDKKG